MSVSPLHSQFQKKNAQTETPPNLLANLKSTFARFLATQEFRSLI